MEEAAEAGEVAAWPFALAVGAVAIEDRTMPCASTGLWINRVAPKVIKTTVRGPRDDHGSRDCDDRQQGGPPSAAPSDRIPAPRQTPIGRGSLFIYFSGLWRSRG